MDPAVQSGASGEEDLGRLLCGESGAAGLMEQIHLGSLKVPAPSELTEADRAEMAALPGPFCADLYLRLTSSDLGPLVWKYIKPWIRGRILVFPSNPQTRRIMREANATFTELAEWTALLESFSAASSSLGAVKPEDAAKLQDALKNPVLGAALRETLELDSDEISSLLRRQNASAFLHSRLGRLSASFGNVASCIRLDRIRFFSDEAQFHAEAHRELARNSLLAAIVFDHTRDPDLPQGRLARHIKYTIRMDAGTVPRTHSWLKTLWDASIDSPLLSNSPYLMGFAQVQDMVESAVVRLQGGADDRAHNFVQRLPSACVAHDVFKTHIKHWLGLFGIAAWLLGVGILVRTAVMDADSGIGDVLSVSGMRRGVAPAAWAAVAAALALFQAASITLLLKYSGVLGLTDASLIFVLAMSFQISLIAFCLMVSALFRKTALAVLTGILLYLMAFIPFLVIHMTVRRNFSFPEQLLSCLLAPTAFGYASIFLAGWEEVGLGAKWSNMGRSPWHGDDLNIGLTLGALWLDTFIYLILAFILTKIKERGLKRLLGFKRPESAEEAFRIPRIEQQSRAALSGGVVTHGLWKWYGGREAPAVRDLNLVMKPGEITALLGHNGAGKSSSIGMITGLLEPSRGECLILGKPSREARNGLVGFCPQANVLFPRLSVRDHLLFYARLKGRLEASEIEADIQRLLRETGLESVSSRQARFLSGGMQRRLCVALAFVGGSVVVVLDEPSAGVDPLARRAIWRLLGARAPSTAILLSTHYLDEADILADRIAVLHKGALLSTGTSGQLKAQFGVGYRLRIRNIPRGPTAPNHARRLERYLDSSDTDRSDTSRRSDNDILRFVRESIPRAVVGERTPSGELVLILPTSDGSAIAEALGRLDAASERLGILGLDLGETTLEEVFMTQCYLADEGRSLELGPEERLSVALARQAALEAVGTAAAAADDYSPAASDVFSTTSKGRLWAADERAGGLALKLIQLFGLLYKRACHSRRDWRVLLSGVLLPVLFVFIAMGFTRIQPAKMLERGPLYLQPESYGHGDNIFFADLSPGREETRRLFDALTGPSGIGTACMASRVAPWEDCQDRAERVFSSAYVPTAEQAFYDGRLRPCQCSGSTQICPLGSEAVAPPRMKTRNDDLLYNLSGVAGDFGLQRWLGVAGQQPRYKGFGGWAARADADGVEFRSFYDSQGLHALPAFLNGAANSRLRAATQGRDGEFGVSVASFPMSASGGLALSENLMDKVGDIGISLVFLCAFSFIPAGLIIYPVQERMSKQRQLQTLSGVGPLLYWGSALLWDFAIYTLATLLSAAVLAAFQIPVFTAAQNLPASIAIILAYGLAMLPLMYWLQRWFSDGTSAYLVLFCASVFIGINTVVSVVIMNVFAWIMNFGTIASVLEQLFLVFPQFCLAHGFVELATNQLKAELYQELTGSAEGGYKAPLGPDVAGPHLASLLIQAALYFTLAVLADAKAWRWIWKSTPMMARTTSTEGEAAEVVEERNRVLNSRKDVLRIIGLRKVFRSPLGQPNVAVKDVSLGVQHGECMALLGVNGAGKTTTFKILTGEMEPTAGEVILDKAQELGYCPQEEATDGFLSVSETLRFVGYLKGYHGSGLSDVVRRSATRFGLGSELGRRAKDLSGGQRRSLCVAASLVGEPGLVVLDEPSEGMDPRAKRLLWAALSRLLRSGRSLLLTSHSMEECEALATRLALLLRGRLATLGTQPAVKHKYGKGYTIALEVAERSGLVAVEAWVRSQWGWAEVRESQGRRLSVAVPPRCPTPLGALFQTLEGAKARLRITHYSVSQTTLDQIFVNFATSGEEEVETDTTQQLHILPKTPATPPLSIKF